MQVYFLLVHKKLTSMSGTSSLGVGDEPPVDDDGEDAESASVAAAAAAAAADDVV